MLNSQPAPNLPMLVPMVQTENIVTVSVFLETLEVLRLPRELRSMLQSGWLGTSFVTVDDGARVLLAVPGLPFFMPCVCDGAITIGDEVETTGRNADGDLVVRKEKI